MISNLVFFCFKSFSYGSKVFIFNGLNCPFGALPFINYVFSLKKFLCVMHVELVVEVAIVMAFGSCTSMGSAIYMEHGFEKFLT